MKRPMLAWPESAACAALVTALLLAPPSTAQVEQAVTFRSGDGSRFILVPADGPPVVHWALATPAGPTEDPPGFEGLALACARASLNGTWRTGSKDPAGERTALETVDTAIRAVTGSTASGLRRALDEAEAMAAAMADFDAFRRVLAAAPALGAAIADHGATAVLALSTSTAGVGRVAELLVERREQAALRGLLAAWDTVLDERRAKKARDPFDPLRTEALALAYPGHPLARAGEVPAPDTIPDRGTATQVWRRTQRPDRCVHVLIGGFDPLRVRAILERVFASTALVDPVAAVPAPRELPAVRRSVVPGTASGAVAAFRLPRDVDPTVLACAVRWLGPGPDTFFGRELARRNSKATIRCAVVQPGVTASGLLLVELQGGAAGTDLSALSLELCRKAAQTAPSTADLAAANTLLLSHWEGKTRNPRDLAGSLADLALRRPDDLLLAPPPAAPTPSAVGELLRAVLGGVAPAVVEWKPL